MANDCLDPQTHSQVVYLHNILLDINNVILYKSHVLRCGKQRLDFIVAYGYAACYK